MCLVPDQVLVLTLISVQWRGEQGYKVVLFQLILIISFVSLLCHITVKTQNAEQGTKGWELTSKFLIMKTITILVQIITFALAQLKQRGKLLSSKKNLSQNEAGRMRLIHFFRKVAIVAKQLQIGGRHNRRCQPVPEIIYLLEASLNHIG